MTSVDPTPIRKRIDPASPDPDAIQQAVRVLLDGRLVAYPTDTLYGLAADPRQPRAVERLFQAKHRSPEMAVPLIGAAVEQIETCVGRLTPVARQLAQRWWPGPLTLVIDAAPTLNRRLLGGRESVAVRVPDHAVARALAQRLRYPVTATSANRTGVPAPTTAVEALTAMDTAVAFVLDAGATAGSVPSTVVDARGDAPILLRPGVVTWDRVVQSLV